MNEKLTKTERMEAAINDCRIEVKQILIQHGFKADHGELESRLIGAIEDYAHESNPNDE